MNIEYINSNLKKYLFLKRGNFPELQFIKPSNTIACMKGNIPKAIYFVQIPQLRSFFIPYLRIDIIYTFWSYILCRLAETFWIYQDDIEIEIMKIRQMFCNG